MHCLLTFGVDGPTEKQAVVSNNVHSTLARHRGYRALGNTYILQINSQAEWDAIKTAVAQIAQTSPVALNFIMTPLMQGGKYDGWMPEPAWQQINALSQ